MRSESLERRRATFLLAILLLVASGFLAGHQTSFIRAVRAFLWRFLEPSPRLLGGALSLSPRHPTSSVPSHIAGPRSPSPLDHRLAYRRLEALVAENARLRQLLSLRASRWPTAHVAPVIGRDPHAWFHSLVIARGAADGVTTDTPVMAMEGAQDGVVGRILEVAPHAAKVLLVTDPLSAVIGTCPRTGDEGIVVGTSQGELEWQYLVPETQVRLGDVVQTSGVSDLFPPGLPLGWVTDLSGPASATGFRTARLKPAVSPSRLHEVLVLQ